MPLVHDNLKRTYRNYLIWRRYKDVFLYFVGASRINGSTRSKPLQFNRSNLLLTVLHIVNIFQSWLFFLLLFRNSIRSFPLHIMYCLINESYFSIRKFISYSEDRQNFIYPIIIIHIYLYVILFHIWLFRTCHSLIENYS